MLLNWQNLKGPVFFVFQVYVEFDDLDWRERDWISIYKDDHAIFLIEENLVLAPRSSAPYATQHSGTLHPALVRTMQSNTASWGHFRWSLCLTDI